MSGGIGIKGIGTIPIVRKGASFGMPPWDFNPNLVTFTAGMAKRATGVFAAAPIVQGKRDGTGTGDNLSFSRGTSAIVGSYFYPNFDGNQGSISFRITPEWNGNDGITHIILSTGGFYIWKYANGNLLIGIGAYELAVNVAAWTAGTTYNICARWDVKNTLDGTNYACVSINDVHTFGISSLIPNVGSSTITIGADPSLISPSNAIIEGLTIYRRVLYDGTYGVNVGNGDEVNLISAGIDPTTVTGSWDVCFCLPTNATAGALVTGAGEAWSHPHSSNLLTRGFLNDKYYGGSQWGVKFNGTSTYIDCGSGATLDDIPSGGILQVEGWFLNDNPTVNSFSIIGKGWPGIGGWFLYFNASDGVTLEVELATTASLAGGGTGLRDGKWHHYVAHYDNATRIGRIAIDGVWNVAGAAGTGAYLSDAANKLLIGRRVDSAEWFWKGSMGWINIHNDAHYTPGTNFLPPRAAPAADVEEWLLNEGTGVTATAQVTSPANDGTITAGVWEPQWYDEGTPVRLRSVVGSANYQTTITDAAELQNLHDGAFTVDGWFRYKATTAIYQTICAKGITGTNGWLFYTNPNGTISVLIKCVTTSVLTTTVSSYGDGLWHYLKMTFDDAGDRKAYIYVDNVLVAQNQTAGNGAVVSDIGVNGWIGNDNTLVVGMQGAHGWVRWSNVVRGAGMIPRSNPPDPADANTMGQWNADEGYGAVLTDLSGEGNNGAMAGTYSWNNSPAMESDSPGARNYAWGYVFGNDAADEGFKQTWAGLVTGSNYILNASAYSEEGVARPLLVVRDETGSADLISLLGTVASVEKTPDILETAFKLPGLCTSISVKLLNASTSGTVGWNQALLYANLWQDPGFEIGTLPDLVGTPTGSSQSIEQAHSGANSWKIISDAVDEGISRSITVVNGSFYHVSGWVYASASGTIDLQVTGGAFQDGITTVKTSSGAGAWKRLAAVIRATSTTLVVKFVSNAAQTFYVDDVAVF